MAIVLLLYILQGFAVSLGGLRRQVDLDWQRGLSFVQIGLQWPQQALVQAGRTLLACIAIPLRKLKRFIPRNLSGKLSARGA